MPSQHPRVSIGIPVFNGERFLEEAIVSILGQTYGDFELIISDNASTDRTQEICRRYAQHDLRIQYYRNDKNLGAAPNYNRVFQLSNSEYFKWADYDDLIAPDFLTTCVQVLDQYPSVVLCYPRAMIIDESGKHLGEHDYVIKLDSSQPHHRFQQLVLHPATAFEVSGLIRSSAARKTALHGSFPASDLVFLAELALQGPFYEAQDILFFPRYHPQQSARVMPVERSRILFFDTSLEGKITLPKWEYLFNYLRAINQGPITFLQRIFCYIQMLRWSLMPDHFRALGKDILLMLQKSLFRLYSSLRS
jgi:glycosyltransferase involved in cell wall biosynthesis